MQNGKSRAAADRVADVEAAQHTISISNALRMTLSYSPLRSPIRSASKQASLIPVNARSRPG
jgi:hypothetical protein